MQAWQAWSSWAGDTQSALHASHIPLYTHQRPSRPECGEQLRQLEQLLSAQRGPPSGDDVERILGNQVGPVRWHRAQAAAEIMEPRPVLTPVLATRDEIELLPVQRVKWVGHAKRSMLNVTVRCS